MDGEIYPLKLTLQDCPGFPRRHVSRYGTPIVCAKALSTIAPFIKPSDYYVFEIWVLYSGEPGDENTPLPFTISLTPDGIEVEGPVSAVFNDYYAALASLIYDTCTNFDDPKVYFNVTIHP